MVQILSEVMYLPPPPASPRAVPAAISQSSFASPPVAVPAASASLAQPETDKDDTECDSELTSSHSSQSSTVEVRYYVSPSDLNNGDVIQEVASGI